MLTIHKQIVLGEDNTPVAVQIPIAEFAHIEEVLENYGLAKLMEESANDERLSGLAAREYYNSLKNAVQD
ncbi:MAG: hypothetical protein EAZ92_10465 [Candidatus Kapaibacterium sp.]|nr:MAG: hypothetical protein EAZ92_10465 [Candidatus Kapabacteria bacterium]